MTLNWDKEGISIVIPTYKRPDDIIRALKSVEAEAVSLPLCEIVVTDNDPAASAKNAVSDFIRTSQADIHYIHEPNPGVSNARNTALTKARGRYIAFLDDDMEAAPDWVTQSLKACETHDAGLVFCPVHAVMPSGKDIYAFMAPAFDRLPFSVDGYIHEGVATGGAFVDRKRCDMPRPVFDPSMNETGGEDDAFFQHVMDRGTQAYWIENTKCWEHVPEKRATLRYIWLRNFAFGQGPTQIAGERGVIGLPKIFFWMSVGVIQTLIASPKFLIDTVLQSPKRVLSLAKLAQGMGKIFWIKAFAPKLYGN